MIYTSSYNNFSSSIIKPVSISGDKGKSAKFDGETYLALAPKKEFWDIWHKGIGKVPEEENNKYYIEQYFNQVLKDLDPLKVYRDLDYTTLLCYEESNQFCHRHIVSAWFELFLGFEVKEIKAKGSIEEVDVPLYNFIKKTLYQVIQKNINTKGFNNLRALYIFNKSEDALEQAQKLEEKCDKRADDAWEHAVSLYFESMRLEKEFNEVKKVKKLILK